MKLLAQTGLMERWTALAERDRKALLLMLVVIIAALFYLWLWQPSQQGLVQAQAFYQKERELNAYLNQRKPRQGALNKLQAHEVYEVAVQLAERSEGSRPIIQLNEQNQLEVQALQMNASEFFAWLWALKAQNIVPVQAELTAQGAGLLSGQLLLVYGG